MRLLAAALLLALAAPARAYRPFIDTDADVAEFRTVEWEIGTFGWMRDDGADRYVAPQSVVNLGFYPGFELVCEADAYYRAGTPAALWNDSVSVKHVWRQGVLQEKSGPSFASETSVLIPSTDSTQPDWGFEHAFMVSYPLGPLMLHWNFGGGVAQQSAYPYAVWGLIAEKPLVRRLKAVAEVFGQDEAHALPDHSVLAGFIWDTGVKGFVLDVGARRGLTEGAPPWSVTTGFSVATPF